MDTNKSKIADENSKGTSVLITFHFSLNDPIIMPIKPQSISKSAIVDPIAFPSTYPDELSYILIIDDDSSGSEVPRATKVMLIKNSFMFSESASFDEYFVKKSDDFTSKIKEIIKKTK